MFKLVSDEIDHLQTLSLDNFAQKHTITLKKLHVGEKGVKTATNPLSLLSYHFFSFSPPFLCYPPIAIPHFSLPHVPLSPLFLCVWAYESCEGIGIIE